MSVDTSCRLLWTVKVATMSDEQFSPKNIYLNGTSLASVVIVKNIPVTTSRETLVDYLEVLCDRDLLGLYFVENVRTVVLAGFKQDIIDIDYCMQRVKERQLGGQTLQLLPVSQPTAIFVTELPDLRTGDPVLYYLEHRSSGAGEGYVKHCQHYKSIEAAIVHFEIPCVAFPGVLRKLHTLCSKAIQIEPFIPDFHDDVIQFMIQKLASHNTIVPFEETQVLTSDNNNSQSEKISFLNFNTEHTTGHCKNMADKDFVEQHLNIESVTDSETQLANLKFFSKTNLGMWMEECEIPKTSEACLNKSDNVATQVNDCKSDVNTIPSARHMDEEEKGTDTEHENPFALITVNKENDVMLLRSCEVHPVEESVDMEKEKVILLGMSELKKNADFCQITFMLKEGRVLFKGDEDNVRICQLKMFEILFNCEECSEIISPGIASVLTGSRGEMFFEETLMKKEVQAVGSLKDVELRCVAFNQEIAIEGLKALVDSVASEEMSLTANQLACLTGRPWKDLSEQLTQQYLIKLEHQSQSVVISGATTDVVVVKREVANFLTRHSVALQPSPAPKVQFQGTTTDVMVASREVHKLSNQHLVATDPITKTQFCGAKARCIHEKFQGDIIQIQNFLRNNDGDLRVLLKENTLVIELIGSQETAQAAVDKFKDIERCIWHQRLQWIKVAKTAKEHSIVSQALLSFTGKQFLKEFEIVHHCFIDVDQTEQQQQAPIPQLQNARMSQDIDIEKNYGSSIVSRPQRAESLPCLFDLGQDDDDNDFTDQVSPSVAAMSRKHVKHIKDMTVGSIKINLEQGDITSKKADTLVNVVGNSLKLEESVVAKSFFKVAGSNFKQCFDQAVVNFDPNTAGVMCSQSSDGLNCNMIFHMVLGRWKSSADNVKLSTSIEECFNMCEIWGSKHIAFPAVGCGRLLRYPPNVVANCLITSAVNLARKPNCNIKSVSLVVYDADVVRTFSQLFDQESGGATVETQDQYYAHPSPKLYNPVSDIWTDLAGRLEGKQKTLTPPKNHPSSSDQIVSKNYRRDRLEDVSKRSSNWRRSASTDKYSYRKQGYDTSPTSESYRHFPKYSNRDGHLRKPEYRKTLTSEFRNPTSHMVTLKVWAENQKVCDGACEDLARKLKTRFLSRDDINNSCIQNLSDSCIRRIYEQAGQHGVHIKIKKEKNVITVKGDESQVTKCVKHVFQILLEHGKHQDAMGGSNHHRQDQRKQLTRGTKEYWIEVAEFPEVPSYWNHFKHGASLLDVIRNLVGKPRFECSKVSPDIKKAISDLINKTWRLNDVGKGRDAVGLSHKTIRVLHVERIENLDLYKKYSNKRAELFRRLADKGINAYPAIEKLPNSTGPIATSKTISRLLMHDIYPEINEHYFFHGTKPEIVKTIQKQGIETRLSDHKSMFGTGAYAAESPTKADQYADSKIQRTNGEKKMFLIRMLLGHPYLCTSKNPTKYRKAPCMKMNCLKDDCQHPDLFDSVIGDVQWLFREFVVYCTEQCYPEYLITYVRE